MDAVEEIKSRLSIEDVVADYVQLKRAGRNFRGLSPWTSEKTPSFMVSPEKQIWHDFSSGKGGNIFSFVMEMEGLDFKGALELLARKAGIDLDQYRSTGGNSKLKSRLIEANELAAKYYQVQFKQSKLARDYAIKKRGFTKQTLLDFRIGYSPPGSDNLKKFLLGKNFTVKELEQAGLITKSGQKNDMFRNRLMIPLMDGQGQVVGFTARILSENTSGPKYLNTASTLLYDKSRQVFGLHLAKDAIRRSKFVVLVEGNLDVVSSHQAGTKNVVATAGTALTEQHLKSVGSFSDDVRLCFDADSAGLAATERAIPIASKVGISLSVITLPAGKDPDDIIRANPKNWEKMLAQKQYAFDWLIEHLSQTININQAEGKRRLSDAVMPVIRLLSDKVEQDHYITALADIVGVSHDAMRSKLASTSSSVNRLKPNKIDKPDPRENLETKRTQNRLLSILLVQPALGFYKKELTQDMFLDVPAKRLLEAIEAGQNISGDNLPAGLRTDEDYVKILILQYEELYQGLELLELRNEAARLQARVIEDYVKSKKRELIDSMQSADENQQNKLLEQARKLDQLLKNVKG